MNSWLHRLNIAGDFLTDINLCNYYVY